MLGYAGNSSIEGKGWGTGEKMGILTFEERERGRFAECTVLTLALHLVVMLWRRKPETRKRAAKAEKRWVRTPTLMTETSPAVYFRVYHFNVWCLVKQENKIYGHTTSNDQVSFAPFNMNPPRCLIMKGLGQCSIQFASQKEIIITIFFSIHLNFLRHL